MRFQRQFLAILIATLTLAVSAGLTALGAATLSGHVLDTAGKPIAGAVVRVTGLASSQTRTDARGAFSLAAPAPGRYAVVVSAPHYQTLRRTVAVAETPAALNLVLQSITPHVIGSVTGRARTPFNASPLAQKIFPREAYRDQGQPDVTTILDQTPGASVARNASENAAAPLAPANAMVRGGLPFETPTMIDGAPVSLPSSGTLDLAYIPSFVLQEVEVLKGPGDVAGAGGGVDGAINLRTADPTAGRRATLEFEGDSLGGSFTDLAYDGTLPGGKFAFAGMLSLDGAMGPTAGTAFPVLGSTAPCCTDIPGDSMRKAFLAKIRATPNAALTVTGTFLGVNLDRSLAAQDGVLVDGAYAGLLPSLDSDETGRLRFAQMQAHLDSGDDGFDARLYGLDLARDLTDDPIAPAASYDLERGEGLAWQHQAGADQYGLAFDVTQGSADDNDPYDTPVPAGSTVNSSRLRATANLHPDANDEIDLAAEGERIADYVPDPDGARSATWSPFSGSLGFSHTLIAGLALRANAGVSAVAPPLDVFTNDMTQVRPAIGLPTTVVTSNSTVTNIERAAGGDIGLEWRLHGGSTTVSADVYRSTTDGAYMLESSPIGATTSVAQTATWFNGPPMVDSGIEFSISQYKRVGMGFIAQIELPRTYVNASLSNAFYASGNLAVLPGQNIGGGAYFLPGENDVSPVRIPYAQGYTEISYKWPRVSRLSLGMLYEGSNNAYAQHAFATFNSNLELSLGLREKLQLSVQNVFNQFATRLPLAFDGIGVPLAYGGIGLNNANALAPRTFRVMFRQSFGGGALYEH